MDTRLKGIHHITLCPGGAQEDVDFFTVVLGQRLVKQTVLMDGSIPVYHFYYGNADADPGSILTGRAREFCRTWPNQTEVTVAGNHFIQEDSADQIGQALAAWRETSG